MLFVKQQMVDAAAHAVNVRQESLFGVRRLAAFSHEAPKNGRYSLGA